MLLRDGGVVEVTSDAVTQLASAPAATAVAIDETGALVFALPTHLERRTSGGLIERRALPGTGVTSLVASKGRWAVTRSDGRVDVTVTTDGATGTPLEGTPTAQAGTYRFEGDVPGPLSSPSFVVVTLTKPSAGLAITGPNIGPATAASRRDTVRYPPERTRLLQVVAQRALSRTR